MDLSALPTPVLETLSYQEGFSQGSQMAESIPAEQRERFLEGFRDATDTKLDEQAMLYAAGGHSARQAMQQGLNATKMLAGIEDHLTEKPAAYSQEEIAAAFQAFQQLQQQAQTGDADAGKENQEKGETFLKTNSDKTEVTTTASGLQFEVLESSEGDKPSATDEVTVHYTGRLLDGTVFDSSVQRGEPLSFPLNRVIPGWTEGLQLMSIGSKYRFWIPSELAYGEKAPPAIGPNQVLDFEVELLGIGK
jgi:FKBP-type peptidyl-prolyl cis-trans isomerase